MTTISDLPPRGRTGLWYDLTHIKFRYVVLVLACLGAGSFLRNKIFSGAIGSDVSTFRRDSFLKVPGPDHWPAHQKANLEYIARLSGGESPATIANALGPPEFSERYSNNVQILYYRTNLEEEDMYTTRDETTPLVFIADKLVSWSRPAHGPAFDKAWTTGGTHWRSRQQNNLKAIDNLQPGATRAEIIATLGGPDFDDIVNKDFELMSYRTHSVHSDGRTTRSETTPLVLRDEKLVARGDAADVLPADAITPARTTPAPPDASAASTPNAKPASDTKSPAGTGSF